MAPSHVNEADVAHHGSNANGWWNPEGPVRLLFKLNPLRVEYICKVLNKTGDKNNELLKGIKIVDAACGGGLLTEALASLGAEITGVDASDALIKVAKEHAQRQTELHNNMPKYVCSSVEEFAERSVGEYDVVVASEIVEHVVDHQVFLKACCQMLRPGGSLIITTPHKSWSSWWYVIMWLEKIMAIIPRGTHHYNLFITPQQITNIIEKFVGTLGPPLTYHQRNKHGNYIEFFVDDISEGGGQADCRTPALNRSVETKSPLAATEAELFFTIAALAFPLSKSRC